MIPQSNWATQRKKIRSPHPWRRAEHRNLPAVWFQSSNCFRPCGSLRSDSWNEPVSRCAERLLRCVLKFAEYKTWRVRYRRQRCREQHRFYWPRLMYLLMREDAQRNLSAGNSRSPSRRWVGATVLSTRSSGLRENENLAEEERSAKPKPVSSRVGKPWFAQLQSP